MSADLTLDQEGEPSILLALEPDRTQEEIVKAALGYYKGSERYEVEEHGQGLVVATRDGMPERLNYDMENETIAVQSWDKSSAASTLNCVRTRLEHYQRDHTQETGY